MIQGRTEEGVSKSTWNGTLQINLLTMPVALHRATDDEDIKFNQVHDLDAGLIRFDRVCTTCGKVVEWDSITKGRKVGEQMIMLTDDDLASLQTAGVMPKVIAIDRFIPQGAIDPTALGTSYNIVPEKAGLHAYQLIRTQLKAKRRVGVGKFVMRAGSRDSLVILRPYDKLLVLQRFAWPDDIRVPDFKFLSEETRFTAAESELAGQLIDLMSGKWDPGQYRSGYREAVEELLAAKLAGVQLPERPAAKQAAMADVGAVLRASIDAKKKETEPAS